MFQISLNIVERAEWPSWKLPRYIQFVLVNVVVFSVQFFFNFWLATMCEMLVGPSASKLRIVVAEGLKIQLLWSRLMWSKLMWSRFLSTTTYCGQLIKNILFKNAGLRYNAVIVVNNQVLLKVQNGFCLKCDIWIKWWFCVTPFYSITGICLLKRVKYNYIFLCSK